jgi:hypothetical protein
MCWWSACGIQEANSHAADSQAVVVVAVFFRGPVNEPSPPQHEDG